MAKRNWQATFEAPAPGTHPTARLAKIARLPLGDSEAELLWHDASRHRRELLRRLGRDVGQRVALLDYLTNIHPPHGDVAIIDPAALRAPGGPGTSDRPPGPLAPGSFLPALDRGGGR